VTEALTILVVDDDDAFRGIVTDRFVRKGHRVMAAKDGPSALAQLNGRDIDVAVLDLRMPGMDGLDLLLKVKQRAPAAVVLILTGHGTVETAVEAMRRGAADFLQKPCSLAEIELKIEKAREGSLLARENRQLKAAMAIGAASSAIVGKSRAIQAVLDLIAKVRDTESPVLVEGESGTGKELVARALHFDGSRREMPFVAVNCATLQETLLESELFGHKVGAYTGATTDKPGLFEIADRGTLFIDEIAEAAPGVQAKLLRVLETGEFRAVGDVKEKRVKVRVVAATNRVLRELAEEGTFRKDLFFRLNVVSIRVPPLRERREDLGPLVDHFLMRSAAARVKGVRLSDRAMAAAMAYDWPGNVRELFNCLERATLLVNGRVIDDLGLGTVTASPAPAGSLEQVELDHIQRVLTAADGNISKAAEMLGVSRRNLHRKINQYKLKV